MNSEISKPCAAFCGSSLLASGPLIEVALAVKTALESGATDPCLVFDDETGRVIDLDLRGSKADIIARLSQADTETADTAEPRTRGRPKLGVVAREVTLLPRHWEWLAAQQGGASVTLRRLVDQARRADDGTQSRRRTAQEAAYKFMMAIAGDLPRLEEATRALFADDAAHFEAQIAGWPTDIRAYATRLAFGDPPST